MIWVTSKNNPIDWTWIWICVFFWFITPLNLICWAKVDLPLPLTPRKIIRVLVFLSHKLLTSLTFFSLSNLNLAGCSGTRYLTWTTTRNVITRSIWAKCEGAGTCRSSSTTYSGTTGTRFRSRSRWFFTISLKKLLMKALHR